MTTKVTKTAKDKAPTQAPTKITSANRKPLAPILKEGHVIKV